MTASLAAKARISAQETTPGQRASIADLALSMTKNAWRDAFGGPAFSAVLFAVESSNTDPSQPYTCYSIVQKNRTLDDDIIRKPYFFFLFLSQLHDEKETLSLQKEKKKKKLP